MARKVFKICTQASKFGNSDRARYCSIAVVELMQVPIVMVFSIFIPSLYKFVTGSRNVQSGDESDGAIQV